MESKGRIQNSISTRDQAAASQPSSGRRTITDFIKIMEPEIKKALPSVLTPERFTRITLSALSSNPELQLTTPQSFLGAMMTAAQLGVEPNTPLGQAYLIPYKNKGILECQFQLGYKGLIDLAYRSGEVSIIQAHVVYEHDEFEYELGLEPKLHHIPAKENRGDAIYFYAMFRMKDGVGYGFEVMSVDDIRAHAKRFSKAYGSSFSPWHTNFEEMAKKTVLKRVLKYAPLKSDFVRAVTQDETIKTEITDDMYSVHSIEVQPEPEAETSDQASTPDSVDMDFGEIKE